MKQLILASMTLVLTACGEQAATGPDAVPDTLPAGQYQVAAKVEALRSTDKTTPATKFKIGDTLTTSACVAKDGKPQAALFAGAGETCSAKDSYVRSGRLNASYSCTRPGHPGEVMVSADGRYTADSFTAKTTTTTYFAGAGDYVMVAALTAKRVGECSA